MKKKKKAKLKGTEEVSFIILRNYIPRQSWTLDSTKYFFLFFIELMKKDCIQFRSVYAMSNNLSNNGA